MKHTVKFRWNGDDKEIIIGTYDTDTTRQAMLAAGETIKEKPWLVRRNLKDKGGSGEFLIDIPKSSMH